MVLKDINGELQQALNEIEEKQNVLSRQLSSKQAIQPQILKQKNIAVAPISVSQEQKLYDKARQAYVSKDFSQAASLFVSFVKEYPNHRLASNAQYWLGECYYSVDDFDRSRSEFQKVIDFYKDSAKAPDALVKIALTYSKEGEIDHAKFELERVLKLYPNYERKQLVLSLLKELN